MSEPTLIVELTPASTSSREIPQVTTPKKSFYGRTSLQSNAALEELMWDAAREGCVKVIYALGNSSASVPLNRKSPTVDLNDLLIECGQKFNAKVMVKRGDEVRVL